MFADGRPPKKRKRPSPVTNGNGNLDRYLGLLVDTVKRIESKLDKMSDTHDERISALEIHKAKAEGAQKVTSALWGSISGAGSALLAFLAQKYIGHS